MEHNEIQDIQTEIRERFPDVKFPNVSIQPLQFGRREVFQIPDKKAIVIEFEGSNPFVSAICTDSYSLTPFEITVKKLIEASDEVEQKNGPYEVHISLLKNGSRLRTWSEFKTDKKPVKKGDDIITSLGFQSSYDMGWEHTPFFGALRLVCTNGMTSGVIEKYMSHRHVQTLDLDKQKDALLTGASMMGDQLTEWKKWTNLNIDRKRTFEMMEALPFGEKHKEKILSLPETGTGETLSQWIENNKVNYWKFYNIHTQFLSHEVESELVKIEKGKEVSNIFHKMAA